MSLTTLRRWQSAREGYVRQAGPEGGGTALYRRSTAVIGFLNQGGLRGCCEIDLAYASLRETVRAVRRFAAQLQSIGISVLDVCIIDRYGVVRATWGHSSEAITRPLPALRQVG